MGDEAVECDACHKPMLASENKCPHCGVEYEEFNVTATTLITLPVRKIQKSIWEARQQEKADMLARFRVWLFGDDVRSILMEDRPAESTQKVLIEKAGDAVFIHVAKQPK